jgi:hypothetical protein
MTRLAWLFAVLLSVAAPTQGSAQSTCTTPTGSCAMTGAAASGSPCVCATASGTAQGTVQSAAAAPGKAPQYCCTPAGRIGPIPGMNVAVGKACQASTKSGTVTGQACF